MMVVYSDNDDVHTSGDIAGPEDDDAPDWVVQSDTDGDVEPLVEEDSGNAERTEMLGLHEFCVEQWILADQPDSPYFTEDGILYHRRGDKLGNDINQLILLEHR